MKLTPRLILKTFNANYEFRSLLLIEWRAESSVLSAFAMIILEYRQEGRKKKEYHRPPLRKNR